MDHLNDRYVLWFNIFLTYLNKQQLFMFRQKVIEVIYYVWVVIEKGLSSIQKLIFN